jgi:hypothetical protein
MSAGSPQSVRLLCGAAVGNVRQEAGYSDEEKNSAGIGQGERKDAAPNQGWIFLRIRLSFWLALAKSCRYDRLVFIFICA